MAMLITRSNINSSIKSLRRSTINPVFSPRRPLSKFALLQTKSDEKFLLHHETKIFCLIINIRDFRAFMILSVLADKFPGKLFTEAL